MRTTPTIYVVAVLVALIGCRTDVKLSEHRHFPKMPNFSVHPHGDYKASGIDFNAVYYNRHDPPTNSNLITSYNYFRFWPDGKVIVRALDHLPTKTDAEDFTRGYIGYYLITNRTIV